MLYHGVNTGPNPVWCLSKWWGRMHPKERLLTIHNWEKHQRAVLLFRGPSTGCRNGLTETSWSSIKQSVKFCTMYHSVHQHMLENSFAEKYLCPCGKGRQWHPGLRLEDCCQYAEGGDPSPLLCTGEATPGVLHPVLGSPVRETWSYQRESPWRATNLIKRLGHLVWGEGWQTVYPRK